VLLLVTGVINNINFKRRDEAGGTNWVGGKNGLQIKRV